MSRGERRDAGPGEPGADEAALAAAAERDALAVEAERAVAAAEVEHTLFARPWTFMLTAPTMAALPPAEAAEIAFAGRSNVGKSSLLNALAGQKALAKSSNTPGRTRALNFFRTGGDLVAVDMPGYGYARAPKTEVAAWTRLVFDYLRGRPSLARVFLLVDARHGLKPGDREAMDTLDEAAVPYQAVLTKTDKIKPPERARRVEETAAALARRPAAHPSVLATSTVTREGLDGLRKAIADLAVTRGRGDCGGRRAV